MKALHILALLLPALPAWAVYQPYVTDSWTQFGSLDTAKWTPSGAYAYSTPSGLLSYGTTTIVPAVTPTGFDYEVRITVGVNGSGYLYVRMSQDRSSYYMLGITGGSNYVGTARISKVLSGSETVFTTFPIRFDAPITARLIVRQNKLIAYVNSANPNIVYDSDLASGQPGFGLSGGFVTAAQIGPADAVAPAAVDSNSIQALSLGALINRVGVRWTAATDDADGIGVSGYMVYRDSNLIGSSTSPEFVDATATPGTNCTYTIYARDWHDNMAAGASKQVAIAAAGAPDGYRTGLRSTGAYWGAAGEQIDMLSGNLNFSLPLLKAVGRGGWGVGFNLIYDSQIWALNAAGPWKLGYDSGYGMGWKLLAGSIFPVWCSSAVQYYVYTDSTGAEYRLDQNSSGVWTSLESVYVAYDALAAKLYFPDGSFWSMTVQSSAGEPDAGTLYPSLMQDTNGNQILLGYNPGAGTTSYNTSSRIYYILDARYNPDRGVYAVYNFGYTTGATPRLDYINNGIGTAENYSFTYNTGQNLGSPFGAGMAFGTTGLLHSIGVTGLGVSHTFEYGSAPGGGTSAEMSRMVTPLGGDLRWTYKTFQYSGSNLSMREVDTRQMTQVSGGAQSSWTLNLDSSATTQHTWATITDNGAGSSKKWHFLTGAAPIGGLPSAYEEIDSQGATLLRKDFSWTQPQGGRVYQSSLLQTLSPGANQAQSKTEQTLDSWGNITETRLYAYGNLTTPARTYTYTYLNNSNYSSRYIRNRLATASLTAGGTTTTLETNYYDMAYTQDRTAYLHDSTYDSTFMYRGNINQRMGINGSTATYYESTGVPYWTVDPAGRNTSVEPSAVTSYSLPGVATPNSNPNMATSVSYASSWATTGVTNANGAASSTTYDAYGRPLYSTAPDGAVTSYSYSYSPTNLQTATVGSPSRWTKTTLDGFGRTIKVETGSGTTTASTVDTEYAPCACSPLGKLYRVSQPYAPNGTPLWTTYGYDGMGRTLTVTAPDGSVTSYAYLGDSTTVTDPAGKWKTFTTDAFGNLVTVTEPNPAGGANLVTTYTYTPLNQLASVSMPRSEGTQMRTFNWTGKDLMSTVNPENGTVSYTYDSAHRVSTRIDAKGQKTAYTYDSYSRPATRRYYLPDGNGGFVEQTDQLVQFYYDAYSDYSLTQSLWGRLAEVAFGGGLGLSQGGGMRYRYGYNAAGRVTSQSFQARIPTGYTDPYGHWETANFDAQVLNSWDNQGRMTATSYPSFTLSYPSYSNCGYQYYCVLSQAYPLGGSYQNEFDPMGRLWKTNQYDFDNSVGG